MSKQLLLPLLCLFIFSCVGVKDVQEAVNTGQFDKAIQQSLNKLRNNKTKSKNQKYIYLLEEAFAKAVTRDQERISFLQQEGNPNNIREIHKLYKDLKARQLRIRPILPLSLQDEGRAARFDMKNYDKDIIASKNSLVDFLYNNAITLMNENEKLAYRQAYDELAYIQQLSPGYKDTQGKIQTALLLGRDMVLVEVHNDTDQIIPQRLNEDLLNFDTYGLDDIWTVYHGTRNVNVPYDYQINVHLREIEISPEQVREKQLIKEREVKDGTKFLLDDDGNAVRDEDGNRIEVDRMVPVRCEFYQFTQLKTSRVSGKVYYIDLSTGQNTQTFPIESQYIFEHNYARYSGDRRALEESLLDMVALRAIPFPTNEQMVYDTGTDLKENLKRIILDQQR